MTEWEFTGEVKSWIDEIVSHIPIPPFDRCKIEQRGRGSKKRRDLTLLDKSKRPLLTGEVKLPYQADGNSPHIAKVVDDARSKARKAGARFFFTWNVNECVLWETEPSDPTKLGQDYMSWHVASVNNEAQLQHRATEHEIRDWLVRFLHAVAKVLEGTARIGRKPPDQKFMEALESSLRMPVQFTFDELNDRYKKKRERAKIDKWMREEQGWTIYADAEGIRENLERAARFSCYSLVNKLVFHEALLKRYGQQIKKLRIPKHVTTGEDLWSFLEGYFRKAIKITGDYETVFGEDHRSFGGYIPFYSDDAVPHWREMIEHIHEFDFSALDHEVIGTLFERLLSPDERHKYGQFYTRVEVVDLINSFCIREGDEVVMDPACGGGTFLVRAYSRLKWLEPDRKHGEFLKQLYGVDVMNFATHLTTINLAVRDLIDDENYPQILRSDFFEVETGKVFITLPRKSKAKGPGKGQEREVQIGPLDAVVGNPPYIRQEDISKSKKSNGLSAKDYYRDLIKREAGLTLSGRSDIHCYFWPHAATFLKEDGYLCLLTSSQWLDVEYGFKLQEWMLRNFQIVAVFESIDEPWFVGARVATTVTILRRQVDRKARMQNTVRFVQFRRPIAQILSHDGTTPGAMRAADEFREEILSLDKNVSNNRYRARLVSQGDLWNEGVALGELMGKGGNDQPENGVENAEKYYGGKWGVHLRAPDLWFDLVDEYDHKFVPIGKVAEVRFGVKTGKDSFFFPRDCTDECLIAEQDPHDFELTYGVPRHEVETGKVKLVKCGEGYGEIRPIESRYLEPEVHSLMEIDGFRVNPENCARMILLISERRTQIKGKYARKYIEWGEQLGVHLGSTVAARKSEEREWYNLTGHSRGAMFWPKSQQYKHAIPLNENKLQCNCNLYDVKSTIDLAPEVLAGILNSTLVVLAKHQYGRPVGVEGNLKTEVIDVNMMRVPSPVGAKPKALKDVENAFTEMKKRPALQFLSEKRLRRMSYTQAGKEDELKELSNVSELDMPDRRGLDDAVLRMIGVRSKKRRNELLSELYAYLRDFFEWVRRKEEKAIINKNLSRRKMRAKPEEIADQIFEEISVTEKWLFQDYEDDFFDPDELVDAYDIPDTGEPRDSADMFAGSGLVFVRGKKQITGRIKTNSKAQDELIKLAVQDRHRGIVRVPHTAAECKRVLTEYGEFIHKRDSALQQLVENRTSDEDLQEKILTVLHSKIRE